MKHVFTIFFIIITFAATSQEVIYVDVAETSHTKLEVDSFSLADSLVYAAFNYEGVNYRYGGMGLDGMDCSGLICRTFSDLNIKVPHSSYSLSLLGEYIDADLLERGDLIFFKGRSANSVGHVAMVSKIENDLIYMIHSSTSRGVIEEVLQHNAYFMERWLFNRRIQKI
jgi:cell wall-associated NlpC family hydrolase